MNETIRIRAIDSHTGGEPTRVIVDGFPDLGNGSAAKKLEVFRREYDHLRSAVVCEPRGHSAIVGALLYEPVDSSASTGAIFFNNIGYLGMCGHGTIGLMKTLEYTGRVSTGVHKIETPAGTVEAELNAAGSVTVTNVPSYRFAKDVTVDINGYGTVTGDIAYGGNWFFLIDGSPVGVELVNLQRLSDFTSSVRRALERNKISGADGAEIDHVEVFVSSLAADSRNFVLCPGLEYDRSPCGTGTSAKLACLYSDGKLKEGEPWRQESIVGSIFEASVRIEDGHIIPMITGTAHVTAELELILDPNDPYRYGING
jgi:4-hydroxyproline epimerase